MSTITPPAPVVDTPSITTRLTEAMLERPGTTGMSTAYRKIHRTFVGFNTFVPIIGLVVAIIGLWGWGVTGLDLGLMLGLHALTTLGITVGFHRGLTHGGYTSSAIVRGFWAVLGTLAMQGPVIKWVADHRRHHAYSDQEGDPHSPYVDDETTTMGIVRGLLWSHMGWMFAPVKTDPERWAPDLLADRTVKTINNLYIPLIGVSLALPAAIGYAVTGTGTGALRAFIWGGLVRIMLQLHTTWSINSICHVFGRRQYESHDEASNVWWLAILSAGESWHNNHHAFPSSARHGLSRWQFDPSAFVIDNMERLHLVREVRRPTETLMARKRIEPGAYEASAEKRAAARLETLQERIDPNRVSPQR